jgi:hypothetical protein
VELNQQKIDELLNNLMMEAKRQRAAIPYSRVDDFPQMLVFLGPNLEPATQQITWRNESEKWARMKAVSHVAKEMLCQAVVFITDTRFTDSAKASKILGLPSLKEIGLDKWGELYRREITKRYGGYLGNAPADFYSEAIVIVMKGPRLEGSPTRFAAYEKGENDSIRWLKPKEDESHSTLDFKLLPDWWC